MVAATLVVLAAISALAQGSVAFARGGDGDACGEPISVIISSGQTAIGSSDSIWSLIVAPPPLPTGPATVIAANGAWTTLPSTQWISANAGCTNTTTPDCPAGLYSYRLCWEQCGALAPSPLLQILVDNTAAISLDSSPLATSPATVGFTAPATILGFTPGTGRHTLQVDVHNNPFSGAVVPQRVWTSAAS